jgi:hypothetical protein
MAGEPFAGRSRGIPEYPKDLFTRLPGTKITEIRHFTPAASARAMKKSVDQAA